MKIITRIICLSIVMFSCNMSDYSETLPGDYTFSHEAKDYNMISGKHWIFPNVIEYRYNNNYILACQKPNKELYKSLLQSKLSSSYSIYNSYLKDSLTEKYFYSRNEILGDSVISKIYKNKKISFENTEEDIRKGNEIVDSIVKNDPLHKKVFSLEKVYWIIKLKSNQLLGPFSETEFELEKKKLKLDRELDF